jgi:hypothetical protein
LTHSRATLGLCAPYEAEPLQAAQDALAQDPRIGSLELTQWSLLYYTFVRSDLNFSSQDFSRLIHVDARSVRRYQQHGVQRLTQALFHSEWTARREHRRRYLHLHLPIPRPVRLIGRETAFAQMHALVNQQQCPHV